MGGRIDLKREGIVKWFKEEKGYVHKENGQWVTKEIVQTNGPFKGKGNIQTVVTNDKFGYEVGYIESNNLDTDDLNIIEIEGIVDWKIWIKQSS